MLLKAQEEKSRLTKGSVNCQFAMVVDRSFKGNQTASERLLLLAMVYLINDAN